MSSTWPPGITPPVPNPTPQTGGTKVNLQPPTPVPFRSTPLSFYPITDMNWGDELCCKHCHKKLTRTEASTYYTTQQLQWVAAMYEHTAQPLLPLCLNRIYWFDPREDLGAGPVGSQTNWINSVAELDPLFWNYPPIVQKPTIYNNTAITSQNAAQIVTNTLQQNMQKLISSGLFNIPEPDIIGMPAPKKVDCECGAHKVGIKKGQVGHSSWCPWSK